MIVLIGCSPSSGSSFLADLLDSVPGSLCGAELGLFSNKKFYDYKTFKQNPFIGNPSSSIYWLRNALYKHSLIYYGLNTRDIIHMAGKAGNASEFSDLIFTTFRNFRKRSSAHIWFEKTPLNTNCIGEFLDLYPNSKFIYLVRNPVYIYMSLLKRNYGNLISATNWLVEIANYYPFRNNDNVIIIKYEDLIRDPFITVAKLVYKLAKIEIDIDELKENYKNNQYRETLGRQKTWNVNKYGVIDDANKKMIPEYIINSFSRMFKTRITEKYSDLFSIKPVSYTDAIDLMGYTADVLSLINIQEHRHAEYSHRDKIRLFRKWAGDAICGDTSVDKIDSYLNPVI